MADTIQGLSWALERPCPLRQGKDWQSPEVAHRQLAILNIYDHGFKEQDILDGIYVTSWKVRPLKSSKQYRLPCSGIRLDEALVQFGGLQGVQSACQSCAANVGEARGRSVAGCHGFLYVWPYDSEWDKRIRGIVASNRLQSRVDSLFPRTRLLWFGFWMESPLSSPQCKLLAELLAEIAFSEKAQEKDFLQFQAALHVSVNAGLPLHVLLHPPGHTDFGFYTVFPHCPRCKAEGPFEHWQEEYPSEPHICDVCQQLYSPAATYRSEPDNDEGEDRPLEKLLPSWKAEGFQRRFLHRQGASDVLISKILQEEKQARR